MKKILVLLSFLLSSSVYAQGAADICTGLPLANNCYLSASRGDGFQEVKVLKVDTTDDTVLNADSGDVIKFAIGGTTEATLSDDTLTFAGASTVTLSSAGDLILKTDDDAQRVLTFGATSDTALTLKFGDGTADQRLSILGTTADAADSQDIVIAAGGAFSTNRSGFLQIKGNEFTGSNGETIISSGGPATADLLLEATDDVKIANTSGTAVWTVDIATGDFVGAGTGSIGWAVVDGTDNTACTSQCTAPAVFGFDLSGGATAPVIKGPSDATSDICLCAGAS